MDQQNQRSIILAVTGGIAAYKAAELCSQLLKSGAQVRVAMTAAAEQFIAPLTFEALTQHRVYRKVIGDVNSYEMEHISWARWADTMIIAPATADCIARMAHGMSDDPVTTLYLSFTGAVYIAPSMNTTMLEHEATSDNLATLVRRGAKIIEPGIGALACGESGKGRMAEPAAIVAAVGISSDFEVKNLSDSRQPISAISDELRGTNVLITLGPTHEYLDPVRYLSNPSTGAMGAALAREGARRGGNIVSVCGPVSNANFPDDAGETHMVTSADQMLRKTAEYLDWADIMIFVAAVGDFKTSQIVNQKIKRTGNSITLPLVENPDIAQAMSFRKKPGQLMVGFAAETENVEANAAQKLSRKNLDVIVANLVGGENSGFGNGENSGFILTSSGEKLGLEDSTKTKFAGQIWDHLIRILSKQE